jgi:LRR receptor-like serine/threonine-protein kinase FLS2
MLHVEYGSRGIVSTSGEVYSYGILLMKTFTRKKPTDDMFGGKWAWSVG